MEFINETITSLKRMNYRQLLQQGVQLGEDTGSCFVRWSQCLPATHVWFTDPCKHLWQRACIVHLALQD